MMRIVIVGAGISGLSTYLFFKKLLPSSYDICIYESHRLPKRSTTSDDSTGNERPETIGAGLGVSPNGMRVLRHLDLEMHDAVVAQGYPVTQFNMRNARNWSLGCYPAKGGRDMEEKTVMSSRQGVWDCLREKVPGDAIVVGKSVEFVKRKSAGKMVLTFRDGQESEEVDLVIGADGVKSLVRKAVLGDGSADSYAPNYEGLIGVGGFVPTSLLPPCAGSTTMTFGAQGFFGYGACSTEHMASENGHRDCDYYGGTATLPMGRKAMWWSTYETKGVPETRDIDKNDVRKQLLERHAHWSDPVIQKIIHEVEIENLWPVWTTPKLPTWEAEGCVLVGDAAHALPPSSGQGVSQALEDAHTLALLLSAYLTRIHSSPASEDTNPFSSNDRATSKTASVSGGHESPQTEAEALRLATKVYTMIRKPRVEAILDYARKMGDMKRKKGIIEEWLMYGFLWVLLHLPMKNKQNAFLYDYDVDSEVNNIVKARDEACTTSLE